MIDTVRNDLEVASREVVMQAARQLAEVLAETPQFQEFEQAYITYRQDAGTQEALQAFQKKQAALKPFVLLDSVSEADRQELQLLKDRFYSQPSVIRYAKAQENLVAICQEVGDQLSKGIGMDYANSCQTGGCCG